MKLFKKDIVTAKELHELLQQGYDMTLVDVREVDEFNFCKINGSINISLRNLVTNLQKINQDKPVALICHHGVRSMQALTILKENGFDDVASLKGGVESWAIDVDPSMPRY